MPIELTEGGSWQNHDVNNPYQSLEEVLSLIHEATKPLEAPRVGGHLLGSSMELDDLDADADLEDTETSGDFVCPLWSKHINKEVLFSPSQESEFC